MEFIITAHDMLLMHGCAFMEIYRMVIYRNWLIEPAREIKMKMTNIYRLLVRQVLKQKCLYAIMNPLCVIINRLIICLCQSLLVNCLFDMHWACIDYWKKEAGWQPPGKKIGNFFGYNVQHLLSIWNFNDAAADDDKAFWNNTLPTWL